MSTETPAPFDLLDVLAERIGKRAAVQAVNVFAAWANAAGGVADLADRECLCGEDHAADAEHFRHVAVVLANVYDAEPLTARGEAETNV